MFIVVLMVNVIKKCDEYFENGMDDVIVKFIKKFCVIEVFNDLFYVLLVLFEVDGEVECFELIKILSNILDMDLL